MEQMEGVQDPTPHPALLRAMQSCQSPLRCIELAFKMCKKGELKEMQRLNPLRRADLALWRSAHEAKTDASLVFDAAAQGRPMELQRRLRLGKRAGGLVARGRISSEHGELLTPLQAARACGHGECEQLLREAGA